jgi:hypothetical protein
MRGEREIDPNGLVYMLFCWACPPSGLAARVAAQLQLWMHCAGATIITTCGQNHKFATTVTHLCLQTQLCNLRHTIASTDIYLCLQTHNLVYIHMFLYILLPQTVHIYIFRSPQKEEWDFPFLFWEDSDLLSLDPFWLPLPFTSSLSFHPFPPSPLQHQQGLATLVA